MASIPKATKFAVLLLVVIPAIPVYSPDLSGKSIVPLPGKGFYLQTGLIDLHDGADLTLSTAKAGRFPVCQPEASSYRVQGCVKTRA
ncbi:hypothetical protein D6D85_12005 [Candidatus Methanodesulfokora washburnensis]|jgi:hypothetical protein|uniref:Uncharacterized protein n=1 Tax=Candidatus Methanodesulfokora washburnensis TaxID=2478471 RepID=A0A3R9QC43_9CREN|nr:hypothetical protein D6D85_12005 [Candidatus Methanodesulfokores washburnensis]